MAAVVLLLAGAGIATALLTSGDDGPGAAGARTASGGKSIPAPAATPGTEIKLLDGRLVVTAPPGWEQRESSAETGTLKIELRMPGRELLATLVVSAIPGGGSLESTLVVDGASRFEVSTKDGPIQASAASPSGNVRGAAIRPTGSFFLSLSVFAMDGNPLDVAALQKLFIEQVAPQLRFP